MGADAARPAASGRGVRRTPRRGRRVALGAAARDRLPGRDRRSARNERVLACPRRLRARRADARGRRLHLGRFVRARRLFPARVSRVRGCARRGLRPVVRARTADRGVRGRAARAVVARVVPADRGLRWRPVPHRRLRHRAREPPLRGGRGRGARVVGRPAGRRNAAPTTAGRPPARSLPQRLHWRSPRWRL